MQKKCTAPLHNWSFIVQQLYIKFGDRIPLDINITGTVGATSTSES